jgi:AcrR family transcriptional regulator
MSPKIVDKKEKRKEILEAALAIYEHKSIEKTNIETIAKAAGMSKGNFYEYFENKADLINGITMMAMQMFESTFYAHYIRLTTPVDKLRYVVVGSIDEQFFEGGFLRVWMEFLRLAMVEKHPDTLMYLNDNYKQFEIMVAGILQEGIELGEFEVSEVENLSSAIVAQIDALYLQCLLRSEIRPIHKIAHTFVNTILKGIQK